MCIGVHCKICHYDHHRDEVRYCRHKWGAATKDNKVGRNGNNVKKEVLGKHMDFLHKWYRCMVLNSDIS